MRNKIIRRVDALESEEGSRRLAQKSSFATTFFFCRKVVLAYYVGDLKPEEEDPSAGEARALDYQSTNDYLEALLNGETADLTGALRRLLAAFLRKQA
jgi:hypothetical protein